MGVSTPNTQPWQFTMHRLTWTCESRRIPRDFSRFPYLSTIGYLKRIVSIFESNHVVRPSAEGFMVTTMHGLLANSGIYHIRFFRQALVCHIFAILQRVARSVKYRSRDFLFLKRPSLRSKCDLSRKVFFCENHFFRKADFSKLFFLNRKVFVTSP